MGLKGKAYCGKPSTDEQKKTITHEVVRMRLLCAQGYHQSKGRQAAGAVVKSAAMPICSSIL